MRVRGSTCYPAVIVSRACRKVRVYLISARVIGRRASFRGKKGERGLDTVIRKLLVFIF